MDFGTAGNNPAVKTLVKISHAKKIEGTDVSRASISDAASKALAKWAEERNVTLDTIEKRGRSVVFDEHAIFCFEFYEDNPEIYTGTVCVDDKGKFCGEDSALSG